MSSRLPTNRPAAAFGATLLVIAAAPAHAYIDPNLGSMLLQGLLASIAAVGVTAKLYWHRIQAFFSKTDPKSEQEVTDSPAEQGTGADSAAQDKPPGTDG